MKRRRYQRTEKTSEKHEKCVGQSGSGSELALHKKAEQREHLNLQWVLHQRCLMIQHHLNRTMTQQSSRCRSGDGGSGSSGQRGGHHELGQSGA